MFLILHRVFLFHPPHIWETNKQLLARLLRQQELKAQEGATLTTTDATDADAVAQAAGPAAAVAAAAAAAAGAAAAGEKEEGGGKSKPKGELGKKIALAKSECRKAQGEVSRVIDRLIDSLMGRSNKCPLGWMLYV